MPRLDLEAHRDIFGPLPRLSAEELISMAEQVDLRGQGGAAFPFARKLSAVLKTAEANDRPTIVVVNATEGEPGSIKDKMLMIRSPVSGHSSRITARRSLPARYSIAM